MKQPEPLALGSPRSGANQRSECDCRQTDDGGGKASTDNPSKDVMPAAQTDDRKVSGEL